MTRPKLHDVVWKFRDEEALRREIALACAKFLPSEGAAEALFGHFWNEIQSYPLEWPSSSRRPSEHSWRFGRIIVRYRLIPDAQSVEIISITGPSTRSSFSLGSENPAP